MILIICNLIFSSLFYLFGAVILGRYLDKIRIENKIKKEKEKKENKKDI